LVHGTPDGFTPAEQLAVIRDRVAQLLDDRRRCLGVLLDELAPHGVRIVGMNELTPGERRAIDEQFESQIFPVLTPLAVDPGHPFPYVSNLSLSLAVEVRDPAVGTVHFARVKVPKRLTRWMLVPGRAHEFVPLEHVIGENLEALFPGMEILGWYAFRVTRYSDLEFTNLEEPEDLLATIEEQVFERRFGEVIRLELQDDMPLHLRTLLLEELRDADLPATTSLSETDIEEGGHLLDLTDLMELAELDMPELRDPPFSSTCRGAARPAAIHLRRHPRAGPPRPSPVRLVLCQRRAVPAERGDDEHVWRSSSRCIAPSGDTRSCARSPRPAERGKQVGRC
jgi:polyphosphate kinase